jgi:hypothetical protein
MDDPLLLGRLIAYAGLIAATCEYVAILARRQRGRDLEADRHAAAEAGLIGLVRIMSD